VAGELPPPADVNKYPEVPAVAGKLKLYAPAAEGFKMVTKAPLAPPLAKPTPPANVPGMPSIGIAFCATAGSENSVSITTASLPKIFMSITLAILRPKTR
jgi:hypothetical protein